MVDLPVITYEKYNIDWNEEENLFYFECFAVREFEPRNYVLFKNPYNGIATTFELRETEDDGWLYYAIGDSGVKKPCRLLAIK